MIKKYELTDETITTPNGTTLYRIRALRDFANVSTGELGGYVRCEDNLSQHGNAWVYGNAQVSGDAWVYDNAWVSGNAQVYGDARVRGDAWVSGDAQITCATDLICISGIGSVGRSTTVYRTKDDGIEVKCGCFTGNLDEFVVETRKTHGESKYAREYLMFAELIKIHFGTK